MNFWTIDIIITVTLVRQFHNGKEGLDNIWKNQSSF